MESEMKKMQTTYPNEGKSTPIQPDGGDVTDGSNAAAPTIDPSSSRTIPLPAN